MTSASARTLLGVSPSALPDEIRRAFRQRAFELHPDRNPSPTAANDFRELRAAYDALKVPSDGFDPDRIAREIEDAAREADRRRARGGESAQVWQQVRVALDRTPQEQLLDGLATPRGRAAAVAGVAAAIAACAGAVVLGGAAAWGLCVAAAAALGAAAYIVWTADDRPYAVDTHWRGVRDLRWDATVSWDEIEAVQEGDGWLDLVLTEAAARRLGARVPPRVLVATVDGVSYRLPLRTTAPLAGLVRGQLAAALTA